MHHQAGIALGVSDVGVVVVNAVAVEGHRRVAKQQRRRRFDDLAPLALLRRVATVEFRRIGFAVNDVLLFTHAQFAMLRVIVAHRYEQQ